MAVPLIVVMHAKLVSRVVLWLLHCCSIIHDYSHNLTTTYWDCMFVAYRLERSKLMCVAVSLITRGCNWLS